MTKKSWWTENGEEMQALAQERVGDADDVIAHLQCAVECETGSDFRANLEHALESLAGMKENIEELLGQLPEDKPVKRKAEKP